MRFEASKRIRSDQECNFKGKMIQEICKIYGISKSRTSRTIQRITVNMNASIEPCITFPLKKKREWQEFLPELVFAYNCTPHSTTGYSPYYLFFSREPTLAVDHLFSQSALGQQAILKSGSVNTEEWISQHRERLEQAFRLSSERTEKEALRRQTSNNLKATDTNIPVGSKVFLKNGVQGRSKIQNVWDATPYKIVK